MPADDHPHNWTSARSADWYQSASCRSVDVSVFYPPDNERGTLAARRVHRAKEICRACPVIRNCLTTAIATNERYGIWGGLTPDERARLSRTLGD